MAVRAIEKDVHRYTLEAFKPGGWLSLKGFVYLEEQLDYALSVVKHLFCPNEKPVSLLEAETGIGKTIAYLIPSLVYSSISRERIAISTYTIRLQDQIINQDLNLALLFLQEKGLPRISFSQRIGRRHFIDPQRVELYYKKKYSTNVKGLNGSQKNFIHWSHAHASKGTGLIEGWLDKYEELPDGLSADKICLTERSPEGTNLGYLNHKEASKKAHIVITSHACIYENLRQKGNLLAGKSEPPISKIIFDEAHNLPFSTGASDNNLSLKALLELIEVIVSESTLLTKKEKKIIADIEDDCITLETFANELDTQHNHSKRVLYDEHLSPQDFRKLCSIVRVLGSNVGKLSSFFDGGDKKTGSLAAVHVELEFITNCLDKFGKDLRGRFNGISYAISSRAPSLVSADYLPGRQIRQYLTGRILPKCTMLLTSATLSDSCNAPEKDDFTDIRIELGISQSEIFSKRKFFPSEFGTMKFVLPDKNIPKPFKRDDDDLDGQLVLDKGWVIYIRNMVIEAREKGSGVLVLCGSFQEVREIQEHFKGEANMYFHLPGSPVAAGVELLKKTHGVLFSPGLSDGFNERKPDGKQLFKNLILTRLPYKPPSELYREIFIKQYLENMSIRDRHMAEKAFFAKSQGFALRKFRQQLGRGIRKLDDEITIWIGDPRFPYSLSWISSDRARNEIFVNAIPNRFLNALDQAPMFLNDSGLVERKAEDVEFEDIVL